MARKRRRRSRRRKRRAPHTAYKPSERDGGFTYTDVRNFLRARHSSLLKLCERLGIDVSVQPEGRRRVLTYDEARAVIAEYRRRTGETFLRAATPKS